MTDEKDSTESGSDSASLLLRFPAALKTALLESASRTRRSLTAEIIVRLTRSLELDLQASDRAVVQMTEALAISTTPQSSTVPITTGGPTHAETEYADALAKSRLTDPAVIAALSSIFVRMPVDKQLALLTLLK